MEDLGESLILVLRDISFIQEKVAKKKKDSEIERWL